MGPTYGILTVNGLVLGQDGIAAGKFEVMDATSRVVSGDERERHAQNQKIATITKVLSCINCICFCCPCSVWYSSNSKALNRIIKGKSE